MQHHIFFPNQAGESLAGTFHYPAAPATHGVILCHCFTCSRHTTLLRELAESLVENGWAALRFDFSGNGQSQGRFLDATYSKHLSEVQRATQWIADQGIEWLGIAGHSMGAAIAVMAAAQTLQFRAVCAIAGRLTGLDPLQYLSFDQRQELAATGQVAFTSRGRSLKLSTDFFTDARTHDLPGLIDALRVPLMVVHGEADEIIPFSVARAAQERHPDKIELLAEAGVDHMFSDPARRKQVVAHIVSWFVQCAEKAAA